MDQIVSIALRIEVAGEQEMERDVTARSKDGDRQIAASQYRRTGLAARLGDKRTVDAGIPETRRHGACLILHASGAQGPLKHHADSQQIHLAPPQRTPVI